MGRPIKQGIEYFPLDVGFLTDIKIRKITRACGISAIPIIIALLSSIFRDEGYYIRWDNDMPFLIADVVGVSEGAVIETVNKAVQVDFFNANMFEQHGILTSSGIQKRYFTIVKNSKRKDVRVDERFLLILVNSGINSINSGINSINSVNNQQSKEKKSKEKKSIEKQVSIAPQAAVIFAENNFGSISSFSYELLRDLAETYSEEWLLEAMKIAVKRNKRNMKYVEGILSNWIKKYSLGSRPWEEEHEDVERRAREDTKRGKYTWGEG